MNDANYAVLNYLTDVYSIKDISQEGVESAIAIQPNVEAQWHPRRRKIR